MFHHHLFFKGSSNNTYLNNLYSELISDFKILLQVYNDIINIFDQQIKSDLILPLDDCYYDALISLEKEIDSSINLFDPVKINYGLNSTYDGIKIKIIIKN